MGRNVTVPAGYVRQLLQMVEEQGLSVASLLEAVAIDPHDLERDTPFPADKFGQLYQHIYSIAQDEFFGLTSGGKVPNGSFRLMCHCLIQAPTLESAIYRASDFHEICRGIRVKPLLKRQGRYARLSFTTTEVAEESLAEIFAHESPQKIRTTLSMWHHFICWLIGKRLPLKAAYFAFDQPEDAAQYRTLFQSEVRFGQHNNALVFPALYLNYPLIQTPASLRSFLKTAPYQLIVMVDNNTGLKAQVVALIGRDFSQELPGAEEVADRLHMSVSTLRRRLMEEKTTYQKVKDECRREAALNYMNSPQLSISDVAELMGFTDHSAFFRSFKKWTGLTPGAYRQQHP